MRRTVMRPALLGLLASLVLIPAAWAGSLGGVSLPVVIGGATLTSSQIQTALQGAALDQATVSYGGSEQPLNTVVGLMLPASKVGVAGGVASYSDPRITGAIQSSSMGAAGGPAAYTDPRIVGALQAAGGAADATTITNTYNTTGLPPQTEKQRYSRYLDAGDFGAKGDATSDNLAFSTMLGICQSTLTTGCLIQWPAGTWALSTTTNIPITSNTVINGAGERATTFTWNDFNGNAAGTVNNNLFGALLVGNAAQNITFSNFGVQGTRAANGTLQAGSGGYPFIPYNVTNIYFDHVLSSYSRLMAFSIRQSSNVFFRDSDVFMSARDGINTSSCDHVQIDGGSVIHTDDDGIAVHSATSDAVEDGSFTGQRQDVQITNVLMFDTEGIHVLSAKNALISGNTISFSRYHAIDVNTVAANGSNGPEGMGAQSNILIIGNDISNTYDRAYLPDPLVSGADDIQIDGESARSGSVYGAVPGIPAPPGNANGETVGTVHMPYFEVLANSNSTSVPTNGTYGVIVAYNHMTRNLPPSDGTDSRFTALTNYHLGLVYTRGAAGETASLPDAAFRENHVHIFGGVIRGVKIIGNYMQGRGVALELGNSTFDAGMIQFLENTVIDEKYGGILIDNNPAATKAILDVEDNDFDLDPFFHSSGRGTNGTWTSATAGPSALLSNETNASPGVSVKWKNNKVRNASEDMNIDPSVTPAASVIVDSEGNTDYMQPVTVGTFSASNKGIGLGHAAGTKFVILDSDPTSATFGQVLFAPPQAVSSIPTTGWWAAGDFVSSLNPATSGLLGYMRLTTGQTNVAGTDWGLVPLNALASAGITSTNGVSGVAITSGASYYNTGAGTVTPIPVTFSAATGTGAVTATGHVSAVKVVAFNYPTSGTAGQGYVSGTTYPVTDGLGNSLGTFTPEGTMGTGGAITTTTAPVLTFNQNLAETGTPPLPFTIQGGTAGSLATLPDVNVAVLKVAIDTPGNYPGGVAPTVTFGLGSAAVSNAVATGTANLGGTIGIAGGAVVGGSVTAGGFVSGATAPTVAAAPITTAASTSTAAVGPTPLTAQDNTITTCASGNAVALPVAVGFEITVRNEGANACVLEPQSGANIGAGGAAGTTNAGISLAVGAKAIIFEASATQDWQ